MYPCSKETIDAVLREYYNPERNYPIKEICRRYHVSDSSVYHWANRYGPPQQPEAPAEPKPVVNLTLFDETKARYQTLDERLASYHRLKEERARIDADLATIQTDLGRLYRQLHG